MASVTNLVDEDLNVQITNDKVEFLASGETKEFSDVIAQKFVDAHGEKVAAKGIGGTPSTDEDSTTPSDDDEDDE